MNVFDEAELTFAPLGDRALTARAEGAGWRDMAEAAGLLREAGAAWIVDVVPAYDSVTVVYDPLPLLRMERKSGTSGLSGAYERAESEIRRHLAAMPSARKETMRLVELPVCYGGSFGPDLKEAAERSGMSAETFIRRHASAEYTVVMIGFLPGFPYLDGLPSGLSQPRKPSPRGCVPAGSVGIAGGQTGVYPFATPGGWQLIGRTSLTLFDPSRDEPALLRAGDRVKFVPVGPERMKAWGDER